MHNLVDISATNDDRTMVYPLNFLIKAGKYVYKTKIMPTLKKLGNVFEREKWPMAV